MIRSRALATATAAAVWLAACGGGSGNSSTPPPSGGGTTTTNPCSTALTAEQAEAPLLGSVAGGAGPTVTDKKTSIDGDPRGRVAEAMWLHQAGEEQRARGTRTSEMAPSTAITSPAPVAQDVGNIAVMQDTGDIVLPANNFDIRSIGLRFTRSGGGYSVSKIDANFRSTLGTQVTLADDDSSQVNIPFSFTFYGTGQSAAFVNSDGNITFGEEDRVEHRTKRVAPAHRTAARGAVPGRPGSVIWRQGFRQRRQRSVHRYLVQRPWLRLGSHGDCAGDAVAGQFHRTQLRRHRHSGGRCRRAVARAHGQFHDDGSEHDDAVVGRRGRDG